jgi:hypothetical protein
MEGVPASIIKDDTASAQCIGLKLREERRSQKLTNTNSSKGSLFFVPKLREPLNASSGSFLFAISRTLPPVGDQDHGLVGHQQSIAFAPHLQPRGVPGSREQGQNRVRRRLICPRGLKPRHGNDSRLCAAGHNTESLPYLELRHDCLHNYHKTTETIEPPCPHSSNSARTLVSAPFPRQHGLPAPQRTAVELSHRLGSDRTASPQA